MNIEQFYFLKLGEEGSEIAQIASKIIQFTGHEVMSGQPLNNYQRCHLELDDLMAVVEELNTQFNFNYVPNQENIEAKKLKMRKFLNYSIELGTVDQSIS